MTTVKANQAAQRAKWELYSFIGSADLRAAGLSERRSEPSAPNPAQRRPDIGPIARAALESGTAWSVLHLLDDRGASANAGAYREWLREKYRQADVDAPPIEIHDCRLEGSDPANFAAVYRACTEAIDRIAFSAGGERVFLVSAGTPTMYAVLVLLSQTRRFKARLLQTSVERGVEWIDLPVAIAHELVGHASDQVVKEAFETPRLLGDFFAESRALLAELGLAHALAKTDFSVLICGETGTGKEEVAFHMHLWRLGVDPTNKNAVEKARGSFVAVNCAALPPDLVESELFGHTRSAFSGAYAERKSVFEEAEGGTVFLDEVGELPLAAQAKLLRVLATNRVKRLGENQDRSFDARVLAATHRDLVEAMRAGQFREDLLYRLHEGGRITLPPLRAREDRLQIADALLERIVGRYPELTGKRLGESARVRILEYDWPGNVRELLHTLKQAAVRARGEEIDGDTIDRCLLKARPSETGLTGRALPLVGMTLDDIHAELESHYFERALAQFRTKTEAARALGLTRQTLDNRLKASDYKKS